MHKFDITINYTTLLELKSDAVFAPAADAEAEPLPFPIKNARSPKIEEAPASVVPFPFAVVSVVI